jgi:dolichyl-diphosphooligosaccharide--protein glycosyltransferase
MAPIFMARSIAGWFDMDVLNLLLPLLGSVCYLYSYAREGRRRWLWLGFASFWTGLFSYTWPFWFMLPGMVLLYEGYSLVNLVSVKWQYGDDISGELKERLVSLAVFTAGSLFFVLLFCGFTPFADMLKWLSPTGATLNDPRMSFWPNVFATVGELKKPDFFGIVNSVGDVWLFLFALASMVTLLLMNHRFEGVKRESIFFFVIWFMFMFLICGKGIRFTMFLAIPMGIFIGWAVEEMFSAGSGVWRKLCYWAGTAMMLYAAFSCVKNGYHAANASFPLMEDKWYALLLDIKDNSDPLTAINSWWDYGDWFKAVAERPAVFDGQTQDSPRAFWMGRALLTADEKEMIGILRMLNNGADKVFDEMAASLKDPFRALSILKELVRKDRPEGARILKALFPASAAARMEALLYNTPHRAFFLVDVTMSFKMPAISFIGNWDADKVFVMKNLGRAPKEKIVSELGAMGVDPDSAGRLYSEGGTVGQADQARWVTRNLYFYSSTRNARVDDPVVFFDGGAVYNPVSGRAFVYSVDEKKFRVPHSLFICRDGQITEKVFDDSDLRSSMVVIEKDKSYEALFMSPELAQSLFFRMNFLKGRGLEHFRLFADQPGVGSVYEILW